LELDHFGTSRAGGGYHLHGKFHRAAVVTANLGDDQWVAPFFNL
jgi:hypothetical protein